MPRVIAAVLNGGSSSRMGTDKATLEIAGRTMGGWVLEALAGMAPISLGRRIADERSLTDGVGEGPLAGLVSALSEDADAVFIAAADQPWLQPRTVAELIARFQARAVVPVDRDVRQVTCAIYPVSLLEAARGVAERGASIQALLDEQGADDVGRHVWSEWGEDGRSWFSVDTPEALQAGLERFGSPR